jgi:hypothetical protein
MPLVSEDTHKVRRRSPPSGRANCSGILLESCSQQDKIVTQSEAKLAPEHVTAQFVSEPSGRIIGQQEPEPVFGVPQQDSKRDHPALRG